MKLYENKLTNDYIAGFVQGDGSFSIGLFKRKSKDKLKIVLVPTFTLTQKDINKDLMISIIERINSGGNYILDNKNIMRYKVRNLENTLKGIIPFFSKHQLKEDKLLNFIKFKFIVEKWSIIEENYKWYCKSIENKFNPLVLDLIIISTYMNKNTKPSIQLELLSDEDKKKVLNNELSPEIAKELENYIKNFNYIDNLNINFINGLFDADGWITLRLYLNKKRNSSNVCVGWDYGIVSDKLNMELLYKIKKYFNNVGNISERKDELWGSYIVGKSGCLSEVFPKIFNVKSYLNIINNEYSKGPLIKYKKIKKILEILELHKEYVSLIKENPKEGLKILEKMILISYDIKDLNYKNKTSLNEHIQKMKSKLNIK